MHNGRQPGGLKPPVPPAAAPKNTAEKKNKYMVAENSRVCRIYGSCFFICFPPCPVFRWRVMVPVDPNMRHTNSIAIARSDLAKGI